MEPIHPKQYTIRNPSPQLDQKLREKSRELGKSLNEVALEALSRGVGLSEQSLVYDDLDDLIGTWEEDPEFDHAMEMQSRIDPEMWS